MSSFCASDLASLDKSLAGLRESLGKLRAAKPVEVADVTDQLRRAANSAGIVRELVWSELPDASWQSREELDHLIAEIQKILDARALEQLRSRLLALATELERGRVVHRRANRVNELNRLRSQAINELRDQAGLKGVPPTLTGPQADQWIEWACSLQEPEDAESLQALRNGFPHLDDFVANLEPNMWIAAESPAVGILLEPDRDEETPRGPSRPERKRFDESSASSEPNVVSKGGFDPRYVKVVDPRLTEKAPHTHPHEAAASSGIPAMQAGAAVLPTALASLDDSLAGMREGLALLGAAKPVELAEVLGYLKRAAEYARVVRESVWSELPEASWQSRKELDALVAQVQNVVEARALEELRARLLALATELEQGTIVHRRAHRLRELDQLREQAIKELRSQAGLQVAPQTLPGPQADRWIAWAESLREPEDAEALQALRNGFPHLDDFIANLEPNLWVAVAPPVVQAPAEPAKPAEKTPPPSRMAKTRVDEPALPAEPVQAEAEPKPEVRHEEAGFTELLDRLRHKRSRVVSPAEEETQPITKEEHALPAAVVEPASEPVELPAPPVEPPPPTVEAQGETSGAPGMAYRISTKAEELWGGNWRKLLATPAVLVCVGLLLVFLLGAIVWRARRNHAGVSTVQATEKIPDQPLGNPPSNGSAPSTMPTDSATPAAQASTPPNQSKEPSAAATRLSNPKTETAKPSKPQDQNAASKQKDQSTPANQLAKSSPPSKPASDKGVLSPPAAAPGNTASAKKEAAPPAETPPVLASGGANGAGNIVKNIPVAVSTTTDRPGTAAAQPVTTAALPTPAAPPPTPTAPPPASTPPQNVKVSSGVAQGLLTRQVAPQYPQAARQARIQGTVVLQVVIGKDGSVQSLHALSGPALLVPSAIDAVKQWRYKPYQLNGEPVEANTQINVKFSLPNE